MRKAFKRLLPEERTELKRWFRSACVCKTTGGEMLPVHVPANADQLK
jgi:hypothetical protein